MFYKETEFQETEIGKIPSTWEVQKLESVVKEAKSGFASGKRDEKGVLQLRMNSIRTDGTINVEGGVRVPTPPNVDEYILKKGDILFDNTNSVDLIGKTALFKGEFSNAVYSNHLTRLRVDNDQVIPEWITYVMIRKWKLGFFKAMCHRHVHQAGINNGDLLSIKVPIPPLAEQKEVSKILGVVDCAIEFADRVIAQTERLKRGLMQQLLTRGIGHTETKQTPIGNIPKEWQVVKLGDVSIDFIGGGTPSTAIPEYWNGDIAWMTSAHINGKQITRGQKYITKKGLENSATHLIPKGNLLVATRVGIGKVAVNTIDIAISQDLTGVIINREKALPEFLYWVLINNENRLKALAQGSTIKGLLKEDLGKFQIPLPPLEEQQRIDEILSTADRKLELEREEKVRLERIKRGLMDLLLTGKVRIKVD